MDKLLLFICLFILFSVPLRSEVEIKNDEGTIIPVPKSINLHSGNFVLDDQVVVYCNNVNVEMYADSLINEVLVFSGLRINKINGRPESKYISFEMIKGLRDDEYVVDINQERISIQASDIGGIYYGLQTLVQLLFREFECQGKYKQSEYKIPCLHICDYPSLKYRGVMIDVCRHFFTVDEIKKQIRILGFLKINKLHLHLTDNQGWRVEIKKYPELIKKSSVSETYNNGKYGPYYYTQDDIRDLVKYARVHNIEIIPEIEFPGHSLAALVPFPNLSCMGGPFVCEQVFGYEENVFCVGNEDVYGFMQDVLAEIAPLFPSEYIHIGGDECSKRFWKQCPKCQSKAQMLNLKPEKGKTVEDLLQSYAIHRVERFISDSLKKKMIGWHEVLEGGIDKNVTIMSWRDPRTGYRAAEEGHDVIMAPMPEGFYLCDYQGAIEVEPAASGEFSSIKQLYNYNAVKKDSKQILKRHIIGLEACAWTEWCPDLNSLEYFMYPRVMALAENAWADAEQKDWDSFQRRLSTMYVRLKDKKVNFHVPMPEGVLTQNIIITKDTVNLSFTNSLSLPMVYTTDGSVPDINSELVPEIMTVNRNCTLQIATLVTENILSPARKIVIMKQGKPKAAVHNVSDGIRLQIANGLYRNVNDLSEAVFVKDTLIESLADFNRDKFDFRKPSVAVYTGYFKVPETAVYTFMSNDDELWVDDDRIVYNYSSSRFYAHKQEVFLEKGYHKFKLIFSNRLKDGFATCWYDIGFKYIKNKDN